MELGLCATCRNARKVVNRRGSTFLLCALWVVDERFPKYPRLPVLACPGWKPRTGADGEGAAS